MRFLIGVLLLFSPVLSAQENENFTRKTITVHRIEQAPEIDGMLNDPAWNNAAIATNFIERLPDNGSAIPEDFKTEVKIIYDDLGIYFGAKMYDPNPELIRKELTERDMIGNDDFFFILLNGYNDRQQSMQFAVTAAGVQYDAKMTTSGEDPSWNGVWYSDVEITDFGWVAEVFIPYSELRFPKKKIQEWGLNMEREVRRLGKRYSWSFVDNSKGSYSFYDGIIYGIENIQTPVRLSFQPYLSAYLNNYDGNTDVNFNGGMDLKYGINDAFTLDMILIPDFGQAKFDEEVLNLSAFETQFDEKRAFFTEGTELFSLGDLFYSRRVGGAPQITPDLGENEEFVFFPSSVDLINALKISGRTDSGLGIGFFNALTEKTFVEIKNSETGEIHKEVISPLTNYNILVLDQRFGTSSVSFVNTNTLRNGSFSDANATGVYMDLINGSNTFNYEAGAEISYVKGALDEKTGFEGQAQIEKISGKNRFISEVQLRTKNYDINDLGYSSQNNYIRYLAGYHHRLLEPKGFLNNMFLNFNFVHERRLEPDLFTNLTFNFNSSFTTKEFLNFGGGFETTPFGTNDIYEPRVAGRFVKVPAYYDQWLWFSTDGRKKLQLTLMTDWYKYDEKGRGRLIFEFNPRYRVSEKFKLDLFTNVILSDKEEGFADFYEEEILFGQRDRNTIINSLNANYIFNNKMALNLSVRHYFSEVFYTDFYFLEQNGELDPIALSTEEYNTTYNSWNLDLRYSWWFAPGSKITLLYRNAVDNYLDQAHLNLSENFDKLFARPQLNSFSVRINYYLDYNRLRNWFSSPKNEIITSLSNRKKIDYL